jgi:hypothetical protein
LIELARRWSRWSRLPATERSRLVALAIALPIIDIALRTLGLKRTQRWLLRSATVPVRASSGTDIEAGHRLAELVAIAGAHGLYRITCLRQALLLQWWLRRRGLQARLCVGAMKAPDGGLDAHAWAELDGVALGQANLLHTPFEDTTRSRSR